MCCLGFGDRCTIEILDTNDVSTSVCRTRVARSLWKRVSHPSSTSSVKGNLGGQAWLTQVPCLVRQDPKECIMARSARRESKVNTGPLSCEASQPRCCDTRSGLMSLGGSW